MTGEPIVFEPGPGHCQSAIKKTRAAGPWKGRNGSSDSRCESLAQGGGAAGGEGRFRLTRRTQVERGLPRIGFQAGGPRTQPGVKTGAPGHAAFHSVDGPKKKKRVLLYPGQAGTAKPTKNQKRRAQWGEPISKFDQKNNWPEGGFFAAPSSVGIAHPAIRRGTSGGGTIGKNRIVLHREGGGGGKEGNNPGRPGVLSPAALLSSLLVHFGCFEGGGGRQPPGPKPTQKGGPWEGAGPPVPQSTIEGGPPRLILGRFTYDGKTPNPQEGPTGGLLYFAAASCPRAVPSKRRPPGRHGTCTVFSCELCKAPRARMGTKGKRNPGPLLKPFSPEGGGGGGPGNPGGNLVQRFGAGGGDSGNKNLAQNRPGKKHGKDGFEKLCGHCHIFDRQGGGTEKKNTASGTGGPAQPLRGGKKQTRFPCRTATGGVAWVKTGRPTLEGFRNKKKKKGGGGARWDGVFAKKKRGYPRGPNSLTG